MHLVRWLGSAIITLWLVTTLTFLALRMLPGDAIESQLVQSGVSEATIEERRSQLGLTDPIPVQYGHFLMDLLRGHLGVSLYSGQPVTEMLQQRLGTTVSLAIWSLLLASVIGVSLGIAIPLEIGWGISSISRLFVTLMFSTPIYWTATLLVFVWVGGRWRPSNWILAVFVLGFHTAGAIARMVQSGIGSAKDSSHVEAARARGLRERYILVHHILRVGLLPVVTVIALQAGFLFGGTVITETIFQLPGVGLLLLDAALRQDYPVVQGIVVFTAFVYITMNTLADFVYHLIDPRIRLLS